MMTNEINESSSMLKDWMPFIGVIIGSGVSYLTMWNSNKLNERNKLINEEKNEINQFYINAITLKSNIFNSYVEISMPEGSINIHAFDYIKHNYSQLYIDMEISYHVCSLNKFHHQIDNYTKSIFKAALNYYANQSNIYYLSMSCRDKGITPESNTKLQLLIDQHNELAGVMKKAIEEFKNITKKWKKSS